MLASSPSNRLFSRSSRDQSADNPDREPSEQLLNREPSELTPLCHLEPDQAPTEGQGKNNRTKRAQRSLRLPSWRPISERSWTMIGFKIVSAREPYQRLEKGLKHRHVPQSFRRGLLGGASGSLHGDRLHLAGHRSRPMQKLRRT